MGVVCTSENKSRKRSIRILSNPESNNNGLENLNDFKYNDENTYNTAENLKKNSNLIKNKNLSLEHYIFYIETIDKNEYFITSNFDTLKYYSTYKKFYSKWEEILQFTRPQKKFSYRNLNQNHNFIITTTEKKYSSLKIVNNNQEYIKNNNNKNINNNKNFSNIDEANLFNYLENTGDKNLIGRGSQIINYNCRNSEYSDLILKFQIAFFFNKYRFIKYLSKGPPNNIRWTIWVSFALCHSGYDFITEEKYLELISRNDKNFETYEEEQIKKDLNRSNQNKEFFENKNSLNSLYNILKALAIEDPELGYCQGMNILAANFLMISDGNEFETFNMLRFIFKRLELREFFLNGFPKLIMYIFILKEFIKDNLPKLYMKISELDIPEETWIFKWLQTLYNLTLPISITIRLIDCILCFGLEFLINFSLAFIKIFEKKLLFCGDINDFLRTFKVEEIINPNILINSMLSRTNSNFEDFNECNKRFENNKDAKVSAEVNAKDNKIFVDTKNKYKNEKIINNNNNNKNFSCIDNLNELENRSTTNSPNRKPPIYKSKKEDISCFNLTMKSRKESDKNHNSNYKLNNNKFKDENLNTHGNSEKYRNNNNLNNIDDKISEVSFTADNSIRYMINTKEELLAFREKLITKAKKIDLKDAIRKMIDNYTQQNMDIKNKFNDNESSTGDGLNEEKSHVYENGNNLFNNDVNKTGVTSQVPFEISYKSNEKEIVKPKDFTNTYDEQEYNLIKEKKDFNIKRNIVGNDNFSNSIYSIRKNSINSQNSKNSVKDHLLNEIIMEEKNFNFNEQCDLYISNNSYYSINNLDNYWSEPKNQDTTNRGKFCNKCLLRLTEKKSHYNIENENKKKFNNNIKLSDKTSEEENCLYCINHPINPNDNKNSNNVLNNKINSKDIDKTNKKEDEFLNVDLYLQGTNLEHSFNSLNKKNNYYQTQNKIVTSQKKRISFAELRVSNTNKSPQSKNSLKKNPYSCKNISYNNNNYINNNIIFNSEKTQFADKNLIPPCINANKENNSKGPNNNLNYSQNINFPFNYNKNTKNDVHRFIYELNQANQNNCKNNSPVFTTEQISLMHNIKEKLDIIKNFDYLDVEENEIEEDYNNDCFNVDENFDFDNEWENRSKINRYINEAHSSFQNISGRWSPDKLNIIKHKYNSSDLNNCNKNNNYKNTDFSKSIGKIVYSTNKNFNNELEKEINFEEKNIDSNELNSLYEHSYCVYDEINQKVSNNGIKKENEDLNTLSRNDSNKYLNSSKNHLIYNSNESEYVYKKYNKEILIYDNISEISRVNANEYNSEYLKRNNNNKVTINNNRKHDISCIYKNSHINQSSFPNINHQIKRPYNTLDNDVVNCSSNLINKMADLNFNNKIIKKDINTDINQEDLIERNNTLNVKVNGSNKSIIKINIANSLSSSKISNLTSKGISNFSKNLLRKSNKNLSQVEIERYSNQQKGIKTTYENYQNKKDKTNSVLDTYDDERINTISNEYSTFDRTVQNTKNIKGLDTKILISKKFDSKL